MTEPTRAGTAYADPAYAASLSEFGAPLLLPRCGGWLLQRPVGMTGHHDLTGPYPLFSCRDWSELSGDLSSLEGSVVSVVLVADPLDEVPQDQLRSAFPDHFVDFKRHLVRNLSAAAPLPSHHRRQLRRAGRSVDVERLTEPSRFLDDWMALYSGLVARHGLVGIRAFSRESFRRQLELPGMVAFRADRGGETVAITLWLVDGERAYYHLGASSDAGRQVSASYALFAAAVEHLRERAVRVIDFGGVAGGSHRQDGLARFKSGWANEERSAYLCGRILDESTYAALTAATPVSREWFPAYRVGDHDVAVSMKGAAE